MNEITEVLPELLRDAISAVPEEARRDTEEIRIRVDRPVELIQKGQPLYLSYVCTAGDAQLILSRLSNYSMYTLEEELKKDISQSEEATVWGWPEESSSKTEPSKDSGILLLLISESPGRSWESQNRSFLSYGKKTG